MDTFRKHKAKLLQKYPMAIQLNYEIKNIKKTIVNCGIDDGSVHVGISLVQKQKTYNKPIFKGTIKQREDVHNLMKARLEHRRYRRFHKRYRKKRFNNRSASIKKGRITPSIHKKEGI